MYNEMISRPQALKDTAQDSEDWHTRRMIKNALKLSITYLDQDLVLDQPHHLLHYLSGI